LLNVIQKRQILGISVSIGIELVKMKGNLIKEPTETQILHASPQLAPGDYQAIGLAVTQLSYLESNLQHAILIHEVGTGIRPNKIEQATRYGAVMKKL